MSKIFVHLYGEILSSGVIETPCHNVRLPLLCGDASSRECPQYITLSLPNKAGKEINLEARDQILWMNMIIQKNLKK